MPEGIALRGSRVEAMRPEEVLLFLGGLLAILLGLSFFALQWAQGIPASRLPDQVAALVVDVLVGIFLLIAFAVARRNSMGAGIMAIAFSIILVIFGGSGGLIGGLVGLLGGVLAIALPSLPLRG